MSRVCSICSHPDRAEIDRLLVSNQSIQTIAIRFNLSAQSINRHKRSHLTTLLAQAVEVERERGVELVTVQREQVAAQEADALDVMTLLRKITERSMKMLDACDEWLTDPDDPTRYDLRPRAHEIDVHYEDEVMAPDGSVVYKRRKGKLSDLLETVREKAPNRTFTLVETKTTDPRKLVLNAASQLRDNIELLAKLVGELDERPINVFALPQWSETRTALLEALAGYPEARIAVGEKLMALSAGGGE